MNDLKDTPTADLITEWNELSCKRGIYHVDKCNTCGHEQRSTNYWSRCDRCDSTELETLQLSDASKARKYAIAAELDMRCVEAGISIVDGFPTFVCIIRESVVSRGIPFTTITVDVEATELHALLGWLLLKEGGGNA